MKTGVELIRGFSDLDLSELQGVIPFEQREVVVYGKRHPQPRLTKWYGAMPYTYSNLQWPSEPMPPLLDQLRKDIEAATGHRFNTVLANLYRDGSDNIGWHSDDEPLFGDRPVIASLSFGAVRVFKLRRISDHKIQQTFELEHGSLLVMYEDIQSQWQHSVPVRKRIKEPRINLTFRLVPETS